MLIHTNFFFLNLSHLFSCPKINLIVPKITHSNATAVCVCNKKIQKKNVVTCLGSFICAYQTDFNVSAAHAQQFSIFLIFFFEININ